MTEGRHWQELQLHSATTIAQAATLRGGTTKIVPLWDVRDSDLMLL